MLLLRVGKRFGYRRSVLSKAVGVSLRVLLLLILGTTLARADDAAALTSLINDYRSFPQVCKGQQVGPLPPLAADPMLARVKRAELREAGYQSVNVIGLSGLQTADAAMGALRRRHCDLLLNDKLTAIGVSKKGSAWNVRLAEPFVSPQLGDWESVGKEVLKWVNRARAEPRQCGDRSFGPAEPLAWDSNLAGAALAHSKTMAARDRLSHRGQGGSSAGDRAKQAGYSWRRIGENVAAGQGSAKEVVEGWLSSPEHCANIMNPEFRDTGIAFAVSSNAGAKIFWTHVFGEPQGPGR